MGALKDARAGHLKIRGFETAWESCIHQRDPWDWNYRQRGFERLRQAVEQGDWVLVLDPSWPPLSPAFQQINGEWQITRQAWPPALRSRLRSRAQTLEREQREWEALQSRNAPPAPTEIEPAAGPGNRQATLGPHADDGGQNKPAVPNSTQGYTGRLRGEEVVLPGVETKQIQYTKRDRAEYTQLRSQFDTKARPDFVKQMANDSETAKQLKQAGIPEEQLLKMQQGGVPKGWQVHHKIPLDDGGTNDASNLVLIKNDPAHLAITNAQNALTRNIAVGETKTIGFPVPGGNIYPLA